ncbi:MAG: 50S ribosomal protein L13 [Patescibacteria group bacterium]
MDTYMAKPGESGGKWYVVDARGKTLGRLATGVATILSGKNKPTYTPGVDCGDHVIVINADQVVVTGNKRQTKMVYRHSMYPGGLKAVKYGDLLAKNPEAALTRAIRGMLPKNSLGRKMLRKLRVYRGSEHPHAAQTPEIHEIKQAARR